MTTMTAFWITRARLRPDASVSTLRQLLIPKGVDGRVAAAHRLVWSLFADSINRKRDFLWREAGPGTFYLLSERLPQDTHGIFELAPPRAFTPSLLPGDHLAFVLRANATIARARPGGRGKPCDVVMNALHGVPPGPERARARAAAVQTAALTWIEGQGARNGFSLARRPSFTTAPEGLQPWLDVLGHRVVRVNRGDAPAARFGVLDLQGVVEVGDPTRFLTAIQRGFGRAKAFGCGLMLIRRVLRVGK
jgi:CRISPR system Cascade subunit CasE